MKKPRPKIQAEIEGSDSAGLFVAPAMVEIEILRQYEVEVIGRIDAVKERFNAITARRKLNHPAVTLIFDYAPEKLF